MPTPPRSTCRSRSTERGPLRAWPSALTLACALLQAQVACAAQGTAPQELLLQVDVNRQGLDETVLLLRDASGQLLLAAEDLQRWRLRLPDAAPLSHQGQDYYPLKALAGADYQFNEARQQLALTVAPQAFSGLALQDRAQQQRSFSRPTPGGFLNYDLYAEHSTGARHASGMFEGGFFNAWGVGVANLLASDTDGQRQLTRLDSTWTMDLPERTASLRLGDAISRPGTWGRAVRLGGLQYATNFATQPNLITQPLQNIAGQAALPSTVDVYVNNALSSRKEVPPGPFSINNIPVVTGAGDVRVVVRDLLGREQVISQPFFQSASALAPGMVDYSYEIGRARNRYGQASNDYGDWQASATHRQGLSPALTGEVHAEAQPGQRALGLGGVWLSAPLQASLNAALAASDGNAGSGRLAYLGLQRQGDRLQMGANVQLTSPQFRQIGLLPDKPAPQRLGNAYLSLSRVGNGSLALSYASQAPRDADKIRVLSLSYNLGLGSWGFVGASFNRPLGGSVGPSIGVFWTLPLGERGSVSASLNRQQGSSDSLLQVRQSPPLGEGYGYALQLGEQGNVRGDLSAQGRYASGSIGLSQFQGQTAERASLSGGAAFLGGSAHLSRRVDGSFALVQLPGFPNVRVYADNQLAGQTDASGELLLPRLRPYQKNPISIEQVDLPYDTKIDALQLEAVPWFRSGLLLPFPVMRVHGALLTLLQPDGQPLPAGASVRLAGQAESFPVGHGGEVYLTGLVPRNRLQVSWAGTRCALELPFTPPAPGADPLPHLGQHVCRSESP
ncbi:MAG: hypothetical protein RJA36_1347 [Pseudomonadota bacterium]|jgi:outer membrane usher protein